MPASHCSAYPWLVFCRWLFQLASSEPNTHCKRRLCFSGKSLLGFIGITGCLDTFFCSHRMPLTSQRAPHFPREALSWASLSPFTIIRYPCCYNSNGPQRVYFYGYLIAWRLIALGEVLKSAHWKLVEAEYLTSSGALEILLPYAFQFIASFFRLELRAGLDLVANWTGF